MSRARSFSSAVRARGRLAACRPTEPGSGGLQTRYRTYPAGIAQLVHALAPACAAVILVLLVFVGLSLPPQTADMIRSASETPIAAFSFRKALAACAFTEWFWPRAALNAETCSLIVSSQTPVFGACFAESCLSTSTSAASGRFVSKVIRPTLLDHKDLVKVFASSSPSPRRGASGGRSKRLHTAQPSLSRSSGIWKSR